MKRFTVIFLALAILLLTTACVGTKIIHCDNCGAEIEVAENSKWENSEDMGILCQSCEKELLDPLFNE